jgi:hypothetical protein
MSNQPEVIVKNQPEVIVKIKANKVFKHNKSGKGVEFRTDLKKEDFEIKLDGKELKDLNPQTLKDNLKDIPGLKIKPYLSSTLNSEKDDENFKAKIQAVIDYVNNNKSTSIDALKKGDTILIDKFLSKNADKYGSFEKDNQLTASYIFEKPDNIKYLAQSTKTTIVGQNTGAEKDADDLLGFLKAVVESRTKFNADFATFKSEVLKEQSKKYKEAEYPKINNIFNKFRKGKVEFQRYKYYTDDNDNGTAITETYKNEEVKLTAYIGINPDNSEYTDVEKDSQKLIALITKFTKEFISYVEQILITPKKTGGRKSRKVSKGGRKRKTRSNKFA